MSKLEEIVVNQGFKFVWGLAWTIPALVMWLWYPFKSLVHELGHVAGLVLTGGWPGGIEVDWVYGGGVMYGTGGIDGSVGAGGYSVFMVLALLVFRRLHVWGALPAFLLVNLAFFNLKVNAGAFHLGFETDFTYDDPLDIFVWCMVHLALALFVNEWLMLQRGRRLDALRAERRATVPAMARGGAKPVASAREVPGRRNAVGVSPRRYPGGDRPRR